jgi:hypothetical protein
MLSLGRVACGQTLRPQHADTQNWNDVQLTIPLTKQVDFLLLGHLRIGDNLRRPVDERFGAGVYYSLNKHLILGATYLHIEMQPPGSVKSHEDRVSVGGQVRFPLGGFIISDRNVFERRFRRPQIDATRYRNRLQVEHPVGPKDMKLTLFVSDEVFYDWSLNVWPRNRASIGVSRKFNKHFTGEIYFLKQNDSHTRPGDVNVIGTTLRFHI